MSQHPYLRAYMAGITVPTMFLLVTLVFSVAQFLYDIPISILRAIVFPMAVVPNLWGTWNMLYLGLHSHRRLPIGFHGAILPFILVPLGLTLASFTGIPFVRFKLVAAAFPVGLVVYYLAWKYLVRFLNELLGIG